MIRNAGLFRVLLLALLVLGSAGCENKPKRPVPDLIQELKDKDEAVRIKAAAGLAEKSPAEAKEAVPALIEALKDRSPYVRESVAKALGAIGPEARAAVPVLKKALQDPDESVRNAATQALEKIESK